MALNLDPKAMLSSSKFSDLKARLVFLFFALIVYRIGAHVPVPGIDPDLLSQLFQGQQGGVLGMFNLFSGGALSRFTVFALGVMPYISASIIMQLMTIAFPSLGNKNKEGDVGRREIVKYTRWLTVVLAIAQAGAMSMAIESRVGLVLHPGYAFRFTTILSLVTGTMFLMWLGEQITERGLGNGISVIIFSGIVSGLPTAVFGVGNLLSTGALSAVAVLVILFLVFLVTTSVIFVERGQRRITLNYAKRQVGSKVFAPQTSHLPLKLNMSGVVPPIFASSLILFPATLLQWGFSGSTIGGCANFVKEIASSLSPGHPLYIVLYISAIVFFCFFYTALVFNSRQTADNLKKSGAVLPGIRPGEQTARYIDRVLTRLTLCGAVYISLVCLLPEFLILKWNVPFYFGGTSLLIVVVVSMEFMTQIQTYFMSRHYESLLKKQG